MCRALTQGGRRCPCSNPVYRSAQRRAARATGAAAGHVIGPGGGAPLPEPEPLTAEQQWQETVERIRELSALAAIRGARDGVNYSNLDQDTRDLVPYAAGKVLDEAGYGATAAGVAYKIAVETGTLVAAEAEQRAGVTAEQVAADYRARRAEAKARYDAEQAARQPAIDEARKKWRELNAERDRVGEELVARSKAEPRLEYEQLKLTPEWVRREEVQQRVDEAHRELHNLQRELRDDLEPLRQLAAGVIDEPAREGLTKLSAAYQEVLADIRPMGGQFGWHDKATRPAKAAFDEVAAFFPNDWIERSNQAGRAMLPKVSKSRAHYVHGHVQETKKRQTATRLVTFPTGDEPPTDSLFYTFEQVPTPADGYPGDVYYERTEMDVRYGRDDPFEQGPKGTGWEKIAQNGRFYWRRPKTRMVTVAAEAVSEITTGRTGRTTVAGLSETASTCAHELGHRMEYTVPGVASVEHAFRDERTEGEDLVALYGGRKHRGRQEVTKADRFADAYMGKHYLGSDTADGSSATEVFSMGVESLFTGSHGGLAGVGPWDADPHMRAAILGMIATAGYRNVDVPASVVEKAEQLKLATVPA